MKKFKQFLKEFSYALLIMWAVLHAMRSSGLIIEQPVALKAIGSVK